MNQNWFFCVEGAIMTDECASARELIAIQNERIAALVEENRLLKEAYREEYMLARTDELTGLLNRRGFRELLHNVLMCRREHTASVLVLTDLDYFKEVNDAVGHEAGDEVLRVYARTIKSRLRAGSSAARWGEGDEVAIYIELNGILSAHEADARARSIVRDIRESLERYSWPFNVLCSPERQIHPVFTYGIAPLTNMIATPEQWIAAADEKLRMFKRDRPQCRR